MSEHGPRAAILLQLLEELGATHLLGIPDNGSAAVFDGAARSPRLRALVVAREGEAFAIASGLWIGGAHPVVLIQNTGLLESGDALRGTATRMGVPLPCLIGYRGLATLRRAGVTPGRVSPDPALATRADVDSVALCTEPTLRAWDVPFFRHREDADAAVIRRAWARAGRESRPVAVLLEREFR